MSDGAPSPKPDLPSDPADRIDAVCDRFEADWRAGRRLRIEVCLGEVDDRARPCLLLELVALEIELRKKAGESPTCEEYQARFPALDAIWLAGNLRHAKPRRPLNRLGPF